MVDAHRVREQAFAPAGESPVDMIRVATAYRETEDKDKYAEFYEQLLEGLE